MLVEVNEKEFVLIVSSISEKKGMEVKHNKDFNTKEYDELLMKLHGYESGFNYVPFVYIVDITYDNSVVSERMKVVCQAFDEDDAIEIVKSLYNKTSYDTVIVHEIHKFSENDVISEKISL